jgi:hypothetical protein
VTGKPNECAATPDGRYVGVPIRDGDSVDIVDSALKKVVKVLPVKTPHNCFNTGNNNDMYVSSMGSNEIDIIDLKKMDYAARIPTGGIPRPYAVSSDEKFIYTALTNLHGFVISDIPSRKVTERVELPPAPPLDCPLEVNTPTHGLAHSGWQTALGHQSCGWRSVCLRLGYQKDFAHDSRRQMPQLDRLFARWQVRRGEQQR